MRASAALALLGLAAGCTAVPAPERAPPPRAQVPQGPAPSRPAPPPVSPSSPAVLHMPGLEGVIEQGAAALVRQFGEPRLDLREGDMRKLQFAGEACVLDVYLYPLRAGAEPVATHADARRASDGRDVDRAACVQALRR